MQVNLHRALLQKTKTQREFGPLIASQLFSKWAIFLQFQNTGQTYTSQLYKQLVLYVPNVCSQVGVQKCTDLLTSTRETWRNLMDISVFFWKQGKNAVPTLIAWQQDMELCRLTTVPSVILQTLEVVLTQAQGGILCFHFEETCSYMSR